MIENEKSLWEKTKNTSQLRTNFLAAHVFSGSERTIYIGEKCDVIMKFLSEKTKSATYVDPVCGIIPEGEFDLAVVVDPVGFSADYLTELSKKITADGMIILAVRNRFGLKYFAGCREEKSGAYFAGLEGMAGGPFGRSEFLEMIDESGLCIRRLYYPYPDHIMCGTVFSDERLPLAGELWENDRNFDMSRAELFDEQKVYDGLIYEAQFPFFSNSYLFELTKRRPVSAEDILYTKSSNDRAKEFRIYTDFVRKDGKTFYRKRPADIAAEEHVAKIHRIYEALSEKVKNEKIEFNRALKAGTGVIFDRMDGTSMDSYAWSIFEDKDALEGCFATIRDLLFEIYESHEFIPSEDFINVFGNIPADGDGAPTVDLGPSDRYVDTDLLLTNILVDGERFGIIDYEWSFDFPVPILFALYRCIKNFYITHGIFEGDEAKQMMEKFDINPERAEVFEKMDDHMIRDYILRDYTNLSDLSKELLEVSVGIPEIEEAAGKLAEKDRIIDELCKTLKETQDAVTDLQNCTSMKITAPLRAIMALFKGKKNE